MSAGASEERVATIGMARSRAARLALLAVGWMAVGLGAVGVVLPGLPTTPFLLVALWAFARSSRRFHDWLYHHPRFGPPLELWHRERVIPRRAKVVALATMAGSLLLCHLVFAVRPLVLTGIAAVMAAGAAYILCCPSRVPQVPEPISRRQPREE